MKIAFIDFWPSPKPFNIFNNFFVHALRSCADGIEVVQPHACDVLFYGPFGNEHRRYKDCIKIFYTGENILPDYDQCHASLSFNPDSFDGKNMRLPLWYLHIDWFGVNTYDNPEWLVPVNWIANPKESPLASADKEKFCAIVYGKVVDSRLQAIQALSSYQNVEIFGKANPDKPIGDSEFAKLEILAGYRFSLCYENSISPGYHTEKLLHGKISGGIPIYYGHDTVDSDFNPRCFIKAASLSHDELVERVREVDCSPTLYRQIAEEPLLERELDISSICQNIYDFVLNQPRTLLPCNKGIPYQLARMNRYQSKLLERSRLFFKYLQNFGAERNS